MLNVYFTFAISLDTFESATSGILVRVSLSIGVDLMQRVVLSTDVCASISNRGIFIDHNLILGVWHETSQLNFASNSIARVLV